MDEALDWVVRLKTGAPTRADVDALQRWRQQSDAHEQAFKSAARILRHAGIAAQRFSSEPPPPPSAVVASRPRALARRAFLGGAIAAAVGGYMVVRPPLDLWPSLEELSADYRTGKGEHRKIAITPDVLLEMNTQTSIAQRSAAGDTQIELISGEAAVSSSSGSKPFVMTAADGRISARQADFNARCLDGIVTVACLSGDVDVEQGGKIVRLRKAEQISYSVAGIDQLIAVDPQQIAAWQAGQLIFRDKPLASVVSEINRYRPGKIIITNADLKRRTVNGTFQIDKLGDFVAQVEKLFGAQATSLPGGVVLLS
ncbi:transmembrane sensor [Rhodopseudomonas rhenobacensis]|uniref:Transmembrane sensor n=1 Tax=Rhodopseudomonas rhenobacensis TaxID=87461 RepID=A0A7W7Z5S8_9BRAD|nr:FecR domain-containing protein [Rhodopseudomonas rhenobacensis]MBB5048285.1 transmembrane sensor [Rhodopseudomonas rhenobacensis]